MRPILAHKYLRRALDALLVCFWLVACAGCDDKQAATEEGLINTSSTSSDTSSGADVSGADAQGPVCDETNIRSCNALDGCVWVRDCQGLDTGFCTQEASAPDVLACPTPCAEITDPGACAETPDCVWYQANCGDLGQCASQKEAPPAPIKKCTLPPCELRAGTECEANGDCRWLTPGCASEGQTLATEACYNLADCTDVSCDAGYACISAIYDPCAGSDCDACGAEAKVCMKAPPPPPSDCALRAATECAIDGACRWLEPGSCDDLRSGLLAFSAGCYPALDCTTIESCPAGDCREVSADPCPAGDCDACSMQAFLCLPPLAIDRGGCTQFTDEAACGSSAGACEWLTPGCGPDPLPEGCYPTTTHCTANTNCAENQACVSFTYNPCYLDPCGACGADLSFCTTY